MKLSFSESPKAGFLTTRSNLVNRKMSRLTRFSAYRAVNIFKHPDALDICTGIFKTSFA